MEQITEVQIWGLATISYGNCLDRGMKKSQLREAVGASKSTFAKLGKNENVTLPVLLDICEYLQCDFGDIMEALPDEVNKECED